MNNVAEGLAVSQKEKAATLAEGVEFESEEHREKLETLKESYFGGKTSSSKTTETEVLKERNLTRRSTYWFNGAYLRALSNVKQ